MPEPLPRHLTIYPEYILNLKSLNSRIHRRPLLEVDISPSEYMEISQMMLRALEVPAERPYSSEAHLHNPPVCKLPANLDKPFYVLNVYLSDVSFTSDPSLLQTLLLHCIPPAAT